MLRALQIIPYYAHTEYPCREPILNMLTSPRESTESRTSRLSLDSLRTQSGLSGRSWTLLLLELYHLPYYHIMVST